ncbi:glycoside hydrolase family 3 C-terminal domain-containing protein [Vibrio hannami]|nr:glycoside hydrolase family 3 C-terminal domain-containing protein [Vibrio hannami]MDG3086030.1 glycoside hydrolase family 3 C-terminal domain-containing protein [Vibrio hannami]
MRKSLVLLKNKQDILPLPRNQKVILTGSAADDLQKQSGGWNLTWQGDENCLDDFPGATTVKMALEAELGKDNVVYDPNLAQELKSGDIAVVVFGEDPYAEMMGDIKAWQTLEFASLKRSYKSDVDKVRKLHDVGVKVISIFFSGRPLYVNEEISKSDAFIAAFLPGSEGEGITDLIIADSNGNKRFDFEGRLSYSWPNKKRSATVNRIPEHIKNYVLPGHEQDPDGEHAPLFPYGYGLNYTSNKQCEDLDNLLLDVDDLTGKQAAAFATHMYGINATIGDYQLKVADSEHLMGVDVSRNNSLMIDTIETKPFNYQQQQDAVEISFNGEGVLYVQPSDGSVDDLSHYDNENGYIAFDANVSVQPSSPVFICLQRASEIRGMSELPKVDITSQLTTSDKGFITVKVPTSTLKEVGVDFRYLDTQFVLYTQGELKTVVANIRWDTD